MPYSDASTQFAYLQLGTIISTIIRQVELRIDEIPAHDYHVSIVLYPGFDRVLIECSRL